MARRVTKRAFKRQRSAMKPNKEFESEFFERCRMFVERNSSLALDDSYDRLTLTKELVEFIELEIMFRQFP